MQQNLFSILVSNHFGVLMRVTTIFSRRTCNIKSLTVAETHDPKISRITILFEAKEKMANQIYKLLEKLEDVIEVIFLPLATPLQRELVLVKVKHTSELEALIAEVPENCHVQVISLEHGHSVIEFVGSSSQCDIFIDKMELLGIEEICRTGAVALNEK